MSLESNIHTHQIVDCRTPLETGLFLDNRDLSCPGSDLILSKKTGMTELILHGLETFTSYYVKVAAFTKEGDGVKSDKIICTTAQDGEFKTWRSNDLCYIERKW